MTTHPDNTPLQNAVSAIIAQATAEGAPYGMSPSLVVRLWARNDTVAKAIQRAKDEARKHGLSVEWVIKIWETGYSVDEMLAEARSQGTRQ
jgi:uncharacterized protein YggE